MSQNRTAMVYIGGQPSVMIKHQRLSYTFHNRKPLTVPDHLVARLAGDPDFVAAEDLGRPLQDRYPSGGTLALRRWGALGDLLIFRAAVSAACRAMPFLRPVLRCQPQYAPLFEEDPLWAAVWPLGRTLPRAMTIDGSANFDQTAEQDHVAASPDRAALFLQELTVQPVTITADDWRLPIPATVKIWVEKHLARRGLTHGKLTRPLVALQVRGSGPMKSLPRAHVVALAAALAAHAEVVLIEDQEKEVWEAPGLHTMTGRDALHAIELLSHCDLCVCMDSGALWMAHAALCPVLCIMGPTRPEQRITRHPVRASAVRLNALPTIGSVVPLPAGATACPPCFEAAGACKKKFACMQAQPQATVVAAVLEAALAMLRGDVPLPQAEPVPAAAAS